MKKMGVLAVGAVAAGGLALGGATVANAAPVTPTPSASADGKADAPGGKADGSGGKADGHRRPGGKGDGPGRPGGQHTAVTGDEAAKVTAAVTAEDAAVTVSRVVKTADGAYHVFGTKDGKRVHFEVSADLKTVTEGRAGHGPKRPAPSPGRTS